MRKLLVWFKTFLEKAASSLGIELFIFLKDSKKKITTIDEFNWDGIRVQDKYFDLYYKGLEIADKNKNYTDNIYKRFRHYSLLQMAEHTLTTKIEGDFVECGCFRGHTAYCLAQLIEDHKADKTKTLHIFDSFEGLSERTAEDRTRFEMSESDENLERVLFSSSEENLQTVLNKFSNFKSYKGWIPKRFNDVKDIRFSFVHIDVDLYEPIKDSLDFFFPRLNEGGIIVIDDYGHASFGGATRAVDEFIKLNVISLFYRVPMGGAFIIK